MVVFRQRQGTPVGDLQKGSAERGFPDLFWFVLKTIGTNQKKSEQIGTQHSRKQGTQIGTNRKKTGKSEHIGATPFCRPQTGGSDPGTPAGRPAFVPQGVQGHPPGLLRIFFSLCAFFLKLVPKPSWGSVGLPQGNPRKVAGEIQKGTGGTWGQDRKCHKLSQIGVTCYDEFYDVLWRFMSMEQRDGNCHKCRKLS